MNISYVICHIWRSSILFKCVVSILLALIIFWCGYVMSSICCIKETVCMCMFFMGNSNKYWPWCIIQWLAGSKGLWEKAWEINDMKVYIMNDETFCSILNGCYTLGRRGVHTHTHIYIYSHWLLVNLVSVKLHALWLCTNSSVCMPGTLPEIIFQNPFIIYHIIYYIALNVLKSLRVKLFQRNF
jgi:hypothetical protein